MSTYKKKSMSVVNNYCQNFFNLVNTKISMKIPLMLIMLLQYITEYKKKNFNQGFIDNISKNNRIPCFPLLCLHNKALQ